jgi:hypothetical protein
MCRVSCVVCRVSCVVCRVSCVVCRVSCVVRRAVLCAGGCLKGVQTFRQSAGSFSDGSGWAADYIERSDCAFLVGGTARARVDGGVTSPDSVACGGQVNRTSWCPWLSKATSRRTSTSCSCATARRKTVHHQPPPQFCVCVWNVTHPGRMWLISGVCVCVCVCAHSAAGGHLHGRHRRNDHQHQRFPLRALRLGQVDRRQGLQCLLLPHRPKYVFVFAPPLRV